MPPDPPFNEPGQEATVTQAPGESAGATVGHYRLLEKIGEGGMGEVWLAEQREPVRRRVAVKLVKAGMNTREVMARFESERQALALMDHPAIAKVFDAGATPQGTPYFVMEYVAGVPINAYCDNHRLGTHERLQLFIRVCEGVQHAHQKAIIHRDLKPSNILVTEVDGHPAPKIIDFGVAKALTQKLTAETMYTRVGALVGTPEYMSPEQALSSGEDIDTRTDVYSLGIVFYELLSGMPPIELRKIAFDEFLRRLREEDAPRPSSKIRTQDKATLTEVARKRQTDPLSLAKQLHGDLDSIALKALEKDRARRYASPSEFAADIGRYLKNEAVLAVPPSVTYRARKFAYRYRAALATACAFALVLVAATVVSIRQSIRASREAAVAQAVNDFLQNDVLFQASAFQQIGQGVKPDPDIKVRTALERAAQNIGGKFKDQPEVEASIRETIARTYGDLDLYPQEEQQLEQALALSQAALGAQNRKTLAIKVDLARAARDMGHLEECEKLATEAVEANRRALGAKDLQTLRAMALLGGTLEIEGKYPQAETVDSEVLKLDPREDGPEGRARMDAMESLGSVYRKEGKLAQAEAVTRQAVEIETRISGPENPSTLDEMAELASLDEQPGKYEEAEAILRKVIDIRRRVEGPQSANLALNMSDLALTYTFDGKFAEAEPLNRQALEMSRRILGPDDSFTLMAMHDLGFLYAREGKFAEAEPIYAEVLERRIKVLGAAHPETLRTIVNLTIAYRRQGKFSQAVNLFQRGAASAPENAGFQNDAAWAMLTVPDVGARKPAEALEIARKAVKLAPDNADYENTLGLAEVRNRLWDEAIDALDKAVKGHNGSDATDFLFLAMAYQGRGDKAKADENYARGAEMASKAAANNAELTMLWNEAAKNLGKPAPPKPKPANPPAAHSASRGARGAPS